MLCGSRRHTTLMQRTSLCFAAVKLRFVYFKLAFPQALLRGSVCGFLAALPEALSLTSCFFRPPSFQPSPSKLRGPIFEAARLFCKRAAVASACPNARKIFSPASFFKSAMWLRREGETDRPLPHFYPHTVGFFLYTKFKLAIFPRRLHLIVQNMFVLIFPLANGAFYMIKPVTLSIRNFAQIGEVAHFAIATRKGLHFVIPAQARIHEFHCVVAARLRGHDNLI